MTRTKKRFIGDVGEGVAKRFLVKRGFKIICQNYLKPWGEIDIVAKKGGALHFVEVKTVQTNDVSRETRQGNGQAPYNPAENVHPKKLERLHRVVVTYLEERRVSQETEWQIDVVTVRLDLGSKKAEVDFLENIV